VGKPAPEIKIINEEGQECPPARFDASGKMLNPDEAVGQIVNTGGLALFEGYYKNPEATEQRSRNNQYHTGDLAYKDEQGFMFFAGRDIEWARVDGENFLTYPIESIINRHPAVFLSSVYGVPDCDAGDQVMVSLLLEEGAEFDPKEFFEFLEEQTNLDMSPKWVPRYVCIREGMPRTETNKILKRELQRQKFDPEVVKEPIFWRERGDRAFKRFTREDYDRVKKTFAETGNKHLLEIR
jgi:fatty-acyl-CoA synthase